MKRDASEYSFVRHFSGALPDTIPSYEYLFQTLFDAVADGLEYSVYRVFEGNFPSEPKRDELYVITGSNASVYDDVPWITALLEFIRTTAGLNVPLAGICFGHQAVAQALGGKVVRSKKGWGTGIRESVITADAGLRFFPDGKMLLHYNHHDQVAELPPSTVCFASSEFCPHEGMLIRENILTFQGHPEYTDEYNRHLLTFHSDAEPESVRVAGLTSINTYRHMGSVAARWMLSLVR